MSCVDLHIHSCYSDGDLTVEAILEASRRAGLEAISITDHDSIEAYHRGSQLAGDAGLEFIPGVELSTFQDNSEIHILGYFYDPTNLNLNMRLLDLQKKRQIRAGRIVSKLNQMGIEIRLERVLEKSHGNSVGRPHIAEVMVEEEYVSSFHEAFDKYLTGDMVREFEIGKQTPADAIALVTQAGGVAVMAHPAKTLRDDLLPSMVDAGLRGIETFCSGMDSGTLQRYRELSRKYGLICTGGSDFHNDKGNWGHALGKVKVPYTAVQLLKNALETPRSSPGRIHVSG